MFVRQGTLVQILPVNSKSARGRLALGGGREKEREAVRIPHVYQMKALCKPFVIFSFKVRQCFLFSNHMIITTRTQAGRLHLVDNVGRIPLADITLVEDPTEDERAYEPG